MEEVSLEKWKTEDSNRLSVIGTSRKICDYLSDSFPYPYSKEKAENYIMKSLENKNAEIRAIIYNNEIVGSIGVYFMDDIYRENGKIAYFLGEKYWNQGITTKAISLICDYVFSNYQSIHRICADPFDTNMGSIRVLEKNGFILEGILRENVIKNGKHLNSSMYGLLRKEFYQKRD
jgi:ribosomal-protein-alanine N-acetyltransferase